MISSAKYDTNLAMGLGLIAETKLLINIWSEGVSSAELYSISLRKGLLAGVSAYRLRNIVLRCFANRYLLPEGPPAAYLKVLVNKLNSDDLCQILFLYTCRANPVLADFVRQIYWVGYEAAEQRITRERAEEFIRNAIDDKKTASRWAEGQIARMGRYLTGCCADFGLLGPSGRNGRAIESFRIEPNVAAYLAHDLHFSGVGDNAMLMHEDWRLFGLQPVDVRNELKRLSLKGLLVVQTAGDLIRISWKQPDMEALCDVLAQG